MIRRATLVATAIVATALMLGSTGCGDEDSSDPVKRTQEELSDLSSASLELRLIAAAGAGADRTGDVGFELRGPFQPPKDEGDLPVARLESTQLAGAQRSTSTFISDGKRAFVETGGKTVEITGDQLEGLRATTKDGADQFGGLHLDKWFNDRRTTESGGTTTVTGSVDAANAINDVFGLAGALGSGSQQKRLEGKDADRLQKLVKSSEVKLVTGSEDHQLQSLSFSIDFAPADRRDLEQLLPKFSGTTLKFELKLTDVGAPVRVEIPTKSP